MPIFADLSLYYSGTSYYPSRYNLFTPIPRVLPPPLTPRPGKYSPLLPTITESLPITPIISRRPIPRVNSPRRIPPPTTYLPSRPVRIDITDIDVSTPRRIKRDPQRGTIQRDRTVVRLRTHRAEKKKSPGEKLVEKFLIRDKNTKLKEISELPTELPHKALENLIENETKAELTEADVLDCILKQEEEEISNSRRNSDANLEIPITKLLTPWNENRDGKASDLEDAVSALEIGEKCQLQRRNTVKMRRLSADLLSPEVRPSESKENIPFATTNRATKKKKKRKVISVEVSVDNYMETPPLKIVVDEVSIEQTSVSPPKTPKAPKKLNYEVVVESQNTSPIQKEIKDCIIKTSQETFQNTIDNDDDDDDNKLQVCDTKTVKEIDKTSAVNTASTFGTDDKEKELRKTETLQQKLNLNNVPAVKLRRIGASNDQAEELNTQTMFPTKQKQNFSGKDILNTDNKKHPVLKLPVTFGKNNILTTNEQQKQTVQKLPNFEKHKTENENKAQKKFKLSENIGNKNTIGVKEENRTGISSTQEKSYVEEDNCPEQVDFWAQIGKSPSFTSFINVEKVLSHSVDKEAIQKSIVPKEKEKYPVQLIIVPKVEQAIIGNQIVQKTDISNNKSEVPIADKQEIKDSISTSCNKILEKKRNCDIAAIDKSSNKNDKSSKLAEPKQGNMTSSVDNKRSEPAKLISMSLEKSKISDVKKTELLKPVVKKENIKQLEENIKCLKVEKVAPSKTEPNVTATTETEDSSEWTQSGTVKRKILKPDRNVANKNTVPNKQDKPKVDQDKKQEDQTLGRKSDTSSSVNDNPLELLQSSTVILTNPTTNSLEIVDTKLNSKLKTDQKYNLVDSNNKLSENFLNTSSSDPLKKSNTKFGPEISVSKVSNEKPDIQQKLKEEKNIIKCTEDTSSGNKTGIFEENKIKDLKNIPENARKTDVLSKIGDTKKIPVSKFAIPKPDGNFKLNVSAANSTDIKNKDLMDSKACETKTGKETKSTVQKAKQDSASKLPGKLQQQTPTPAKGIYVKAPKKNLEDNDGKSTVKESNISTEKFKDSDVCKHAQNFPEMKTNVVKKIENKKEIPKVNLKENISKPETSKDDPKNIVSQPKDVSVVEVKAKNEGNEKQVKKLKPKVSEISDNTSSKNSSKEDKLKHSIKKPIKASPVKSKKVDEAMKPVLAKSELNNRQFTAGGKQIGGDSVDGEKQTLSSNESQSNENKSDNVEKPKRSEDTDSESESSDSDDSSTEVEDSSSEYEDSDDDCDVNCHRKCEKLMPHLCGVNQKLVVEALAALKKESSASTSSSDADSRSTVSSLLSNPALDPNEEFSNSSCLNRGSGRVTPPATSLPRFRKYTIDDFHFLKVLGKGSFGKVLLAELRNTEYYYAVKCLKKDVVLEDDDVECTLIERKVLALGTKHPYLCHLFCTFQTESHLFFVMEYLNGGDLMFHIQQSGRFPEPRARFYGSEIVSGLRFLHSKGIVYRDLKLDNVLLDFDGHVRIADFGMCKLQIFLDRTADTFCGTPDYMAPEIIKGAKYNQCVDWWSFGVLLYEMLVGQSPFSGCDEDDLFWCICNEEPKIPRYLSHEATSILNLLLEKDSSKRLGTRECGAGDVKHQPFFHNIDWDALERRELEPPFKPRVQHALDVQYFDKAFTAERAKLTPVDRSILQSMDQTQFQGFSYTNPNATD